DKAQADKMKVTVDKGRAVKVKAMVDKAQADKIREGMDREVKDQVDTKLKHGWTNATESLQRPDNLVAHLIQGLQLIRHPARIAPLTESLGCHPLVARESAKNKLRPELMVQQRQRLRLLLPKTRTQKKQIPTLILKTTRTTRSRLHARQHSRLPPSQSLTPERRLKPQRLTVTMMRSRPK
ncbi:hypothetical protein BDV12DRAFT_160670, partial [Aspergillus spectabilis]